MDNYSAERLRQDFLHPLAELVALLTDDARRLEAAAANGDLARDYLPLNATMARRALAQLRRFQRQEVHGKLAGALEGSLRYREQELERNRERRRAEK